MGIEDERNLTPADFARYRQVVVMAKTAADRAGKRRLRTGEETHGVPVTVFLYSKVEAAALLEALDQVDLDERQQELRDELHGFVVS